LEVNGWELFYFRLFRERLDGLERDVTALAEKDPDGFGRHPKVKFLKAVVDNVRQEVPRNPDDRGYRLGKTLGDKYTDWRRVKKHGLPPRYRLFFKFTSTRKSIAYAWLNDENTLRKEGDKNDVYAVFKRMLKRGDVPNGFDDLLKESISPK